MKLVPISADGQPVEAVTGSVAADEAGAAHAARYRRDGHEPPWVGYLAVENEACVGDCAFLGAPVHERVEIVYHTFAGFEGGGVATRMARELVRIAHESNPHLMIAARTAPQEGPSTAILRKLGFQNIGRVQDAARGIAWEWQLE
jgi:RimJ/RimL family protein N-acetyltransferase